MKLGERLFEAVAGKYITSKVDQQVEKLKEQNLDTDLAGDPNPELWRPLTARPTRDLTPLKQTRMQEIAFHMYDRNPLGHRIIEMNKDFVVGEGIGFEAEDAAVNSVLNKFWNDPVNLLDLKQHQKVKELGIFGEQFYPTFVDEHTGHVRLGYLDPVLVDTILTSKENIEDIRKVVGKVGSSSNKNQQIDDKGRPVWDVIRVDDDPNSKTFGRLVGDIFVFQINKTSNGLRGRSDLLPLVDWIDAYERYLFNRGERAHLLNSFIWDIELQGMDATKIQEWVQKQKVPRPGAFRAHNEKVKWEAITPKLESNDASNEARLFLNHILGGAGMPPHWFAWGQGITRATALEMGTPAFKMLKSRQRFIRYMIKHMFNYVIDQSIIHGTLDADVDTKFAINFPTLTEKGASEISTALAQVTTSLNIANENEWISDESASKLYKFMILQLGFESPVSEKEQIKAEEIKAEVKDYLETQPNLKAALDKVMESMKNGR